ncbi:HAD-IIIC family phosphatase [Rhizorhabdus sp.]|uniref:HAD-IIIC family phosphatase n=1 Tax=Rhizorhabdus sp. TaxID=1968843 RepID=UPI0035B22475
MPSFYAPTDLAVTPDRFERIMMLGGCIFDPWRDVLRRLRPDIDVAHAAFDYGGAFEGTEAACDFRLVQIPLRFLYPEMVTMQRAARGEAELEDALETGFTQMRRIIHRLGGADVDRPTLFLNYPLPQRPAMGRLLPRYQLGNPSFFIQRLNRRLSDLVDRYPGGHILDMEQLSSAFGRRFVQDDAFWIHSHGGLIGDFDHERDGGRIEGTQPLSALHRFEVEGFVEQAWEEAFAMVRTLRGTDRVKMVCIDLDDTLWRGVAAEADHLDPAMVEGWPLGFAEALAILKQRGILLAILSKNDEVNVARIFPQLFGDRLTLDDFAIRKIGWRPKRETMAEAIAEANILPEAVVFVDDNPVERAAMKAAFPAVRTLEASHRDWRRILLWAPETQVPAISAESARRTEMVQAQVQREQDRGRLEQDDFLASLGLSMEMRAIRHPQAAGFGRALELINKTNQFNTSGRRWGEGEAAGWFADGGRWWVFSARDRHVDYGLVGVLVERDGWLEQFVMSCRVFGLQLEQAALALLRAQVAAGLSALLLETDRNGPCRNVFRAGGWTADGDRWMAPETLAIPDYIAATLSTD